MAHSDVEYYRARAIEEREQARVTHRQYVAEIHRELARLYEALVDEPAIRPKLSISYPTRLSA